MGNVNSMRKRKIASKKRSRMRSCAPVRKEKKSAQEALLDSFAEMIDSAAENMSAEDFRNAEKTSNEIFDQAIAAHSRRRETA